MNGLGQLPWPTLFAVQQLCTTLLHTVPPNKVFQLATQVRAVVARVKEYEPERIPMRDRPAGLLMLSTKRVPCDDFALAESLIKSDPNVAPRVDAELLLTSYIAVESLTQNVDDEWVNSALAYLVTQVSIESEISAAWQETLLRRIDRLGPLAAKGEVFSKHTRPKGSIGPLGKAIDSYLRRNRMASAIDVWNALAKKPPRGMAFFDNRTGRYIENSSRSGELGKPTSYGRFKNAFTESRQRLGITKKRTVNRDK